MRSVCAGIYRAGLVCAGIYTLASCTTSPPVPICPTLIPYTAAQQAQAAKEHAALPPDSIIGQMITDYGELRAQTRACQGEKP